MDGPEQQELVDSPRERLDVEYTRANRSGRSSAREVRRPRRRRTWLAKVQSCGRGPGIPALVGGPRAPD